MISEQVIILLRHGKAIKNEQDIHGGNGSVLLDDSFHEIKNVGNDIKKMNLSISKILYTDRKQCEQTASTIAEILKVTPEPITDLQPINLGIVNGLSNKEVAELFPEISKTLIRWRNGEIEINSLNIDGIDDNEIFYQNGCKFLNKIKDENLSSIIVGTRSILVLLASILLDRTTKVGGNYREIKWGNTEYLLFSSGDIGTTLHITLSSLKI